MKEKGMVPACITAVFSETPTVKRFTLAPQGPLTFLPGQWVDFAVPGITAMGGYSFISTPRQLQRCGSFELAVRRSAHPIAEWLHDKAQPGDNVAVRVGGSFTYLPGDERRPLLILAGGIGINPLLSILQHCCELAGYEGSRSSAVGGRSSTTTARQGAAAAGSSQGFGIAAEMLPPHAVVLYSASAPDELAFKAELERLQRWAGGRVRLELHVTAPEWKGREAEWGGHWGRIDASNLRHALRWLGHASSRCGKEDDSGGSSVSQQIVPPSLAALLCGPAAMEDVLVAELRALGVAQQQIRYERWW